MKFNLTFSSIRRLVSYYQIKNISVEKKEGEFVNVIKSLGDIKSRHEAPKVYDMNASFYIFRRSYFESDWQISTTDRSLAYVMPHLCFDIDEPIDFEIMNFLISNNKLDFEF